MNTNKYDMPQIREYTVTLGCDPELFIATSRGKIVEASQVIPPEGLSHGSSAKVIIDGVQAEINPIYSTCRQSLSIYLGAGIKKLYEEALKNKDLKINWNSSLQMTQKELDAMSDRAKQFGCSPSMNAHTGKESIITAKADKYTYRGAGGHIHLGNNDENNIVTKFLHNNPTLAVQLLDIIVGNTLVMLDRDPMQVERRKNYGRAGEYRLPKHGIEYRTPSNFWLRSYELFGLTFGLARLAVIIGTNIYEEENDGRFKITKLGQKHKYRKLLELVDMKDIQNAINNNDFDLAKANWDKIKDCLCEIVPIGYFSKYPINKDYIEAFDFFISQGIEHWFKEDPLQHWTRRAEKSMDGWEVFLSSTVSNEMRIFNEKKSKQTANQEKVTTGVMPIQFA